MKKQIEEIIRNNTPEEATEKILKLVVKPDVSGSLPFVSIDFYAMENLLLEQKSQDTIRIKIKALGEFTIPKDKFFNGVDELKNKWQ
jgi:hypothetical protein